MATRNPLVSIVIPVYNSQEYISGCLFSIINQSYKNVEIIIVDDGSTDQTDTIINEIIDKNENVKIVLNKQQNSGPSVARNNGIRLAQGEFIAFLDSDDQWYPNKLERLLDEFEKDNELDVVGSLYSIGEKVTFKRTDGSLEYLSLKKLLFKNYLLTSGVVCRAKVFSNVHFNEHQKYSEDYRLWLEIAAQGNKCAIVNECLLRMNEKPIYGASGLSSRLWEMEKGELNNFTYIFSKHHISLFEYIAATLFSFIKYLRRLLIVRFNIN